MIRHSVILSYLTIMMMVMVVLVHVYERFQPLSNYVIYTKVEPTKDFFRSGEPILMRSYFRVKQLSTLHYTNVLFCYSDFGPPAYISTWLASRPGVHPVDYTEHGAIWQYNGQRPATLSDCFIQVSVQRKMDYSQPKEQVVDSSSFRLEP